MVESQHSNSCIPNPNNQKQMVAHGCSNVIWQLRSFRQEMAGTGETSMSFWFPGNSGQVSIFPAALCTQHHNETLKTLRLSKNCASLAISRQRRETHTVATRDSQEHDSIQSTGMRTCNCMSRPEQSRRTARGSPWVKSGSRTTKDSTNAKSKTAPCFSPGRTG